MNEIKIIGVEELSKLTEIKGKLFESPDGSLVVEVPEGTMIKGVLIKPVNCDYGILYS